MNKATLDKLAASIEAATEPGPDGNPLPRLSTPQPPANSSGGSGLSGGDPMIDIAGLKKNVGFLNWVAGIAGAALVGLYFILSGMIDTRFDRVDGRLRDVQIEASRQYGAIDGMEEGIRRIEEKLDGNQPQESN